MAQEQITNLETQIARCPVDVQAKGNVIIITAVCVDNYEAQVMAESLLQDLRNGRAIVIRNVTT